ncbi:MAG: T9SS type A sorting domain-containing protein [Bacteroidales bacterium]|nr:T9SS type A sorting domain-containing protein [Bacteroidales bacterium]
MIGVLIQYYLHRWLILCVFMMLPMTAIAQSPGFFLDDWEEKTADIPPFEQVEKSSAEPTVYVTVEPGTVVNKVPKYIYGNNAVTWDDGLRKNATAMTDLNNLNPHVLRWPGGNLSNNYFWNASYGQRPADIPPDISPWYGMNCPDWQMSLDEYYDLLDRTNCTGIICVNYSYARYGTGSDPVATAAHMAAEWVRYDNGRSKFWEIGNENFGNWQSGYEIDVSLNQDNQPRFISGQLYGQHCRVFINSMRAAAAETGVDIKIGINIYDAETSWDPIQTVWNEEVMPEVGDLADFLVVHSYFTPYDQNSTVSVILNSHTVPGDIMQTVERDMTDAGKPMIPLTMTEWNIFAVGSMQQVSYVNGMLAAITLGEFIKHNYGLANRWDLVNGWNNGDDHGTFSSGGEPGVDSYNPRPVFFYMFYHQKFFGDHMVEAAVTGNNNVIAHASTFSSGETGLVIINKSRDEETVQVDFSGGDYGLNYYYYTLTGGVDNGDFSRKVLINGYETDEQGGGPDDYATIGARASKTYGGIKVDLPPLAVVYMLVEKRMQNDPVGFAFVVKNMESGSPVDDCEVTFLEETKSTNMIGEVWFEAQPGNYTVSARKLHFNPIIGQEVEILQETETIDLFMDSSDYRVTFVVKDINTDEPLNAVTVSAGAQEELSNEDGEVTLTMHAGARQVLFSKESYAARSELFEIESDTTLQVFLSPVVFSGSGIYQEPMLYPNPASNRITLCGQFAMPLHIKILDTTGTILQQETLEETAPPFTLKLKVPPGLYIIMLQAETGRLIKKLVVE